jgi:hypothetical protein
MHLVDPGPLIEERMRTVIEPLEARLAAATMPEERETLERELRQERRHLRRLQFLPVAW